MTRRVLVCVSVDVDSDLWTDNHAVEEVRQIVDAANDERGETNGMRVVNVLPIQSTVDGLAVQPDSFSVWYAATFNQRFARGADTPELRRAIRLWNEGILAELERLRQ